MHGTHHVLIGAAIGAAVGDPYLAAGLGFASHAAADAVPHWDYHISNRTLLLLDGFLAGGTVLALALTGHIPAAVGGFFAACPDGEGFLKKWGFINRCLYPSHSGLTAHPQLALPMGELIQTGIALMAAWVLYMLW